MLLRAIGHILSCKDASRLLSQGQDRPLSSFRQWRLKLHLMTCDACTRFERQLRFLREAMRRYKV